MKTVLVPTDLSPVSQNASDYAAGICREMGADMILLHVYMIPAPISELSLVLETADEIHQSNENALKKEVERIYLQRGCWQNGFCAWALLLMKSAIWKKKRGSIWW